MKLNTTKTGFSPVEFARLVNLNKRLSKFLNLETISAKRDPATGTFTGASKLTAAALRRAWSGPATNPGATAFKNALLAKIREPKT